MRMRYLVSMAGADFTRNYGDIAEVDEEEARRLIHAGFAEEIYEGGFVPEAASIEPPENAAMPRARGRKLGK
jgi:hypothetical protein